MISAAQLYDFVQCPRRVALDEFGGRAKMDAPNVFVELLWEQGISYEFEVVQTLDLNSDLSGVPNSKREVETLAAMSRGDHLIYGGRLSVEDLVGEPDLLERRGHGYMPIDIKSGSGVDGEGDGAKLKKNYAYQLAHYVHILDQLGFSDGAREGAVLDRNGGRIAYVLTEPQGAKNAETWWASYLAALDEIRQILAQKIATRGALCAACKLCHWNSYCKQELVDNDDLTLIAELGRAKRDAMSVSIPTVRSLADVEINQFIQGKKTSFKGIGPDTLRKFRERAKHLVTPHAAPYINGSLTLPIAEREIYFDIESDPMRDMVYLHGFVERLHGRAESARFIYHFSDSVDSKSEEDSFRSAWNYLNIRVIDSVVYYYSKFERTAYKKLASRYPNVCALADVDAIFSLPAMVDVYEIVLKSTEWPLSDRSIKTLAQYLGFRWRDTHPSGAASIEWYHRWIESGKIEIKQRILDYNEDDCLATSVLVDKIRAMVQLRALDQAS